MSDSRDTRKPRRDAELISAGNQMSNVMFSLSQMSGTTLIGALNQVNMRALQEQWDAAKQKYMKSFKRARRGGA